LVNVNFGLRRKLSRLVKYSRSDYYIWFGLRLWSQRKTNPKSDHSIVCNGGWIYWLLTVNQRIGG